MPRWLGLQSLAWINVVLHVAGMGFAALGMRPGTGLAPMPDRMEFLAEGPLGWVAGWAVWMACALALLLFLGTLVHRRESPDSLAQTGLALALVGLGFDLFCDSVYLLVFPKVASLGPHFQETFLILERITGIGSVVIANGAYSAGITLTNYALRRRGSLGDFEAAVGYLVGLSGFALAVAGFAGNTLFVAGASVPTMTFFCLWVVLVARAPGVRGEPA